MKHPPIIPGFPKLIHGGDDNPDQRLDRPDVIDADFMCHEIAPVKRLAPDVPVTGTVADITIENLHYGGKPVTDAAGMGLRLNEHVADLRFAEDDFRR